MKSEDVVIPEEFLEYEREAEARRSQQRDIDDSRDEDSGGDEAGDPFALRVEQLLNTSKQTLQEKTRDKAAPEIDVTVGEVVETLEDLLPDTAAKEEETEEEPISLEEALRREKLRSTRASKRRRKKEKKQPILEQPSPTEGPSVTSPEKPKKANDDLPTGFKVLLVAIVLIVATVVVLLGPLMHIDRVEVNDLKNMTMAQVEEIAGNPIGQNLFLYRTGKAEQELSYYPYVQSVEIKRHFPHWIEIEITERQPAGVLLNNGSYLQFSKDGVLLDNTRSLTHQSLPLITGFSMEEVPSPGEAFKDNARFSDILKIVNACSDDLLTMIQEINIKDRNNILAYTSQGIEVRIGNVDDIEARMAALDDIMNQVILSGIIEDPIEAIDIRYAKAPVVVLEGYDNIDVSEYVDDEDSDDTQSGSGTAQSNTAADQGTGYSQDASGTAGNASDAMGNTSDPVSNNGDMMNDSYNAYGGGTETTGYNAGMTTTE